MPIGVELARPNVVGLWHGAKCCCYRKLSMMKSLLPEPLFELVHIWGIQGKLRFYRSSLRRTVDSFKMLGLQ